MKTVFKFGFLQRRARNVRELVVYQDASVSELEATLSASPAFVNLDSITIWRLAATNLLGIQLSSTGTDEYPFQQAAFRMMARNISSVSLWYFDGEETRTMLAYFPFVRTLKLFGGYFATPSDLPSVVAALPELESLALTKTTAVDSPADGGLHSDWTALHWTSASSLRFLSFDAVTLAPCDWAFVETISTSLPALGSLELTFDNGIAETDWGGEKIGVSSAGAFLALRSLRLRGPPSAIIHVLPFFTPLHLATLHLVLNGITFPPGGSSRLFGALLSSSRAQTTRITVREPDLALEEEDEDADPPLSKTYRLFLDLCHLSNIRVEIEPRVWDPSWSLRPDVRGSTESHGAPDLHLLRKAIDEVLEFGSREATRMEPEGDYEGTAALAETLRGLKGKLLLEQD